nr:MAG TPA: hypothetical protein [Caudoviricetes sp.]
MEIAILFGPVLIPIIAFSLVKHVNFPFQRKELRHLDFRKIGVNCRYIQKMNFKQNGMPMTLMKTFKNSTN